MPKQETRTPFAETSVEHEKSLNSLIEANRRFSEEVAAFLRDRNAWATERSWLRAMIDQVPDYLFVKDVDGRFVVANIAVAADLGGDPNDLLGKTDLELHPPELAQKFHAIDKRVIETGEPMLNIEEFVMLGSGSKRWLSTSKLPLRDAAGEIIGLVGIARDITERKRAEDEVRYLAFHDPLTGLPNRRQFERSLSDMVAALSPMDAAALLYVDLDRFKHINDTLGHPAGDALIRQVGERLAHVLPAGGMVARIGGDEFAVVTAAGGSVDAAWLAEAVLAELDTPFNVLGNVVHVGGSVGVALIDQRKGVEQVLREADTALYEAKGAGRGRWLTFQPRMAEALELRADIEKDLRQALIAGDQLILEYQPVYASDETTLLGAEALMRWHHPTRGLLSPGAFIQIAEDRGLIEELGDWALQQACDMIAGTALPWVAVNVSPIQLRNPDFADHLLGILAAAHVEPARFQIEITEGVFLDDPAQTEAMLKRLREAGIKVAIDDFGTGYSSLSYLHRYNVDKLKVDREFVSMLGTTKSAEAIVRCIVSLGRAMEMRVTAEGVETAAQATFLRSLGCHELQGYLLSRPLTLDRLRAVIEVHDGR